MTKTQTKLKERLLSSSAREEAEKIARMKADIDRKTREKMERERQEAEIARQREELERQRAEFEEAKRQAQAQVRAQAQAWPQGQC